MEHLAETGDINAYYRIRKDGFKSCSKNYHRTTRRIGTKRI